MTDPRMLVEDVRTFPEDLFLFVWVKKVGGNQTARVHYFGRLGGINLSLEGMGYLFWDNGGG